MEYSRYCIYSPHTRTQQGHCAPFLCSPQFRPISTSKLNSLRSVHSSPINPVIYRRSIAIPHLGVGLALEMLSALIPSRYSYPALPLLRQQAHQGSVPPGPLVLGRAPLKNQTLALDRDRTVLRRSEPSSRTLLTGEQPDPWDLLQPQDRMSRHRCLFVFCYQKVLTIPSSLFRRELAV